MTAKIINGKEVAESIKSDIVENVKEMKEKFNMTPGLAVVLVGHDPASEVYVANKRKAALAVGMNSFEFKLAADVSEQDLIKKIAELNHDKKVHGILVQLPLPAHLNSQKVIEAIDYHKDVDGFHVVNVGKLSINDASAVVPCTPLGCLHLLKMVKGDNLAGLKAVVIGSSNIVGKPMAKLLINEKCTVTIANSKTRDLRAECLQADIIISATGVAGLVKSDMVKKGAIVIDVGINRVATSDGKTKLVGDVDFENVKEVASAITPVPGGVGPMTIAYLLKNTLNCFLKIYDR